MSSTQFPALRTSSAGVTSRSPLARRVESVGRRLRTSEIVSRARHFTSAGPQPTPNEVSEKTVAEIAEDAEARAKR